MPYFLDDSIRSPYILESILFDERQTTAFLVNDPPDGVMWAHSITPGFTAGVSIALWSHRVYGNTHFLTNALRAVAKAHGLHRFFALVCAKNVAAQRLCTRLGFTQEGIVTEGARYRGVWEDMYLYGLLTSRLGES